MLLFAGSGEVSLAYSVFRRLPPKTLEATASEWRPRPAGIISHDEATSSFAKRDEAAGPPRQSPSQNFQKRPSVRLLRARVSPISESTVASPLAGWLSRGGGHLGRCKLGRESLAAIRGRARGLFPAPRDGNLRVRVAYNRCATSRR